MIIGQSRTHCEAMLSACMQPTVLSPAGLLLLVQLQRDDIACWEEEINHVHFLPLGTQSEPIWFTQRILFFPCKGKKSEICSDWQSKGDPPSPCHSPLLVKQARDHLRGGLTAIASGCQSLQPFQLSPLLTLPRKQQLPWGDLCSSHWGDECTQASACNSTWFVCRRNAIRDPECPVYGSHFFPRDTQGH